MTDDSDTPRHDTPRPENAAGTAAAIRRRTGPQAGDDLRGADASAARDRSAHRRATWLYDDLLS